MTCHLNSAPFLYLHHNHCQSQNIIFIRLLYLSTPGFPLKTKISSLQKTLTLTHLIIHPHNLALNDTHLNGKALLSSDHLEIGPELTMDYPLDNQFDLSQRS